MVSKDPNLVMILNDQWHADEDLDRLPHDVVSAQWSADLAKTSRMFISDVRIACTYIYDRPPPIKMSVDFHPTMNTYMLMTDLPYRLSPFRDILLLLKHPHTKHFVQPNSLLL